ncbi:Stromal membrane-associated protein 2 [Seminavis robusta]|uniref:Stromal membrane-associated protein 2 n=1 Tax=Seminavis robusta TaxID=568900 RepID=A0A9N8DUG4_9STRA|nr:Stromal membrane-associated protein 2 [Seminavis robusta]|eukprot:Sro380_g130630.1 Stromal membrane-associated protein 2 (715) ;mRNA; r:22742-24970
MPTQRKSVTSPEMNERMKSLMLQPANRLCADCPSPRPLWASFLYSPVDKEESVMAVFVCSQCAQHHHFKLGSKRCLIKYLKMAHEWSMKDIEILEFTGNDFVNRIYERNLTKRDFEKSYVDPDDEAEEKRRSKFIKHKYKHRKYTDDMEYHEKMLQVLVKRRSLRKKDSSAQETKNQADDWFKADDSIQLDAEQERRTRFLLPSHSERDSAGYTGSTRATSKGALHHSYTEGVGAGQSSASPTKEYEKTLHLSDSTFVVLRQRPQQEERSRPLGRRQTMSRRNSFRNLNAIALNAAVANSRSNTDATKMDDSTQSSTESGSRALQRARRRLSNRSLSLTLNGSGSSVNHNHHNSGESSVTSSSQGSSVDESRRMRRRISTRNLMSVAESPAPQKVEARRRGSISRPLNSDTLEAPGVAKKAPMIRRGSIRTIRPLEEQESCARGSFNRLQPQGPMARRRSLSTSNVIDMAPASVEKAPLRRHNSCRNLNLLAVEVSYQPNQTRTPMTRRRSMAALNAPSTLSPPKPLRRRKSAALIAVGLPGTTETTSPVNPTSRQSLAGAAVALNNVESSPACTWPSSVQSEKVPKKSKRSKATGEQASRRASDTKNSRRETSVSGGSTAASSETRRKSKRNSKSSGDGKKKTTNRIPTAVELGYEDPEAIEQKLQTRKEKIRGVQTGTTSLRSLLSDSIKETANPERGSLSRTSSIGSAKAA